MRDNTQFSNEEAAFALEIAKLPHEYEKAQKQGVQPSELKAESIKNAPENVKANVQIIQVGNTTCVIAYDDKENTATVSFDPTFQKRDYIDNFFRGHKDHSLGGEVHGGNYSDLIKNHQTPNLPGDYMSETIAGVLYDHSSKNDAPLTVNFTGFSRGGGLAVLEAGQLIAQGVFDDPQSIKMGAVYTFGTMAVGDHAFIEKFNEKTQELGGKVFTIELQGDKNPTTLTENGSKFFTKYDYEQAGEPVFIKSGTHDAPATIIINPSEDELTKLRELPATTDRPHSFESYTDAVKSIMPAQEIIPTIKSADAEQSYSAPAI